MATNILYAAKKYWNRKHKVTVNQRITGSVWSIEKAFDALRKLFNSEISKKIGTSSWSKGVTAAENFYKEWGEFAITGIYSINTQETRVYIFSKKLNPSSTKEINEILNSEFVRFTMSFLSAVVPVLMVRKVEYKAGNSFSDVWSLKSNKLVVGGTGLAYFYLAGTARVKLS